MNEWETSKNLLGTNNRELALEHGIALINKFINRDYLVNMDQYPVQKLCDDAKVFVPIRLFQIEKIMYNQSENVNDKLISVFSALQDLKSTVLMLVDSDGIYIRFYLGIRSLENASTAGKILEKSFMGNFPGSEMHSLKTSEIYEVMSRAVASETINTPKNVSCVTIVPAERDKNKAQFVQGMEKFIDTMQGNRYTAMFIASPVEKNILEQRKRGLEELYSTISSFSKITLTYGTNYSEAVSNGTFKNFSQSIGNSISNSTAYSSSRNSSFTSGRSDNFGIGYGGINSGSGTSNSQTEGYGSSNSWSKAITDSMTDTTSEGTNRNISQTTGENKSMTINHDNKAVQNIMIQIDEQLKRIKNCEAYGLWDCACYFISQDVQTATIAANTYKALIAGEESAVENSYTNLWGIKSEKNTERVLEYMRYGMHPVISVRSFEEFSGQNVVPTCLISGNELPLMFNLPRKSVNGLIAMDMAEFGRNVFLQSRSVGERKIEIGNVYHMGRTEAAEVMLDVDSFASHCFITGSTGSGKSNTSYRILDEMLRNGVKFLVIEPAKGEYKKDFGGVPGIHIFCTNPRQYRMLHLNPFAFPDDVHILEHLERIIEIFSACWPLYGAMPAILKEAIEKTYERNGWDMANSIHISNGRRKYPTFADLLEVLPVVINNTGYSSEARSDYRGALVTRVSSLTAGISGQIFCSNSPVGDDILFDENTIVDLSRIGSSETKSLIMGILIMKLNEYRMSTVKGENIALRHVTVLEEAHNILKRTSTEQSQEGANLMGKSVEMISNSIAEMRTYGEGFIIIDQSPTAVDISAIKNTNTKIIMRLPEQADCQAIGNAIALEENQIRELSRLGRGKAVIMQNNWLEAVLTDVHFWGNKYHTETQMTDYREIVKLRGVLADEITSQRKHHNLIKDNLKAIVEESNVAISKKAEYMEYIDVNFDQVPKTRRIAQILRELLGTEGLFKVVPFPSKLVVKDSRKVKVTEEHFEYLRKWVNQILYAAEKYYDVDTLEKQIEILRYLIYDEAMTFSEDSRYIFVYHLLFDREGNSYE